MANYERRRSLYQSMIRLVALLTMVIGAQHVLADCPQDAAAGYQINQTCRPSLKDDGTYMGSYCIPEANADPTASAAGECKATRLENGVPSCNGSICFRYGGASSGEGCLAPLTPCTASVDCCGANKCKEGFCGGRDLFVGDFEGFQ